MILAAMLSTMMVIAAAVIMVMMDIAHATRKLGEVWRISGRARAFWNSGKSGGFTGRLIGH